MPDTGTTPSLWQQAFDEAVLQLLAGAGDETLRLRAVRERLEVARAACDDPGACALLGEAAAAADAGLDGAAAPGHAVARVGELLERIAEGDHPGTAAPAAAPPGPSPGMHELLPEFLEESFDLLAQAEQALLELEADAAALEPVHVAFRAFHTIKSTAAFLGLDTISRLAHESESLLLPVRDREVPFDRTHADALLAAIDRARALLDDARAPDAPATARAERDIAPAADAWSRVRTARLDQLVELAGELVTAHAMVAQDPDVLVDRHGPLFQKVLRTTKLVRELQEMSLSLRMVPLRPLFQNMQRLIRDLARQSGKPIRLVTVGGDTEIDRAIVDMLADPLVHLIRNAVDHAFEPAAERSRAGKPETGTLHLGARHAEGAVIVELRDDGRGLDRDAILRRARERGIIGAGQQLSPAEIDALIFAPGLSTAASLTELSGRGVGMDVVQRSIEAARGHVEVTSRPGVGTTFTLRLPLTLAIAEGMLVRVGSERYIVPTASIVASFRPTREALVREAHGGELVMLHDCAIPILRLHHLFDVPDAGVDPAAALLVVVEDRSERFALLVDELLGQQQLVARPLGPGLGAVPGLAATAVLGDGRVGLILDPGGLLAAGRTRPPWRPRPAS